MRQSTIEVLYQLVLDRVIHGKSRLAAETYLKRIGVRLEELRAAYQNSTVSIDYSDVELIDAYLLAYFPHYADAAAYALAHVECDALREWSTFRLKVLFIGGGPLPELVALVDRLLECRLDSIEIDASVLDIHADQWEEAIRRTVEICQVLAPKMRVSVNRIHGDVLHGLSESAASELSGTQLIVVQNCLNEVAGELDEEHKDRLFSEVLSTDGVVVISDLTRYSVVCEVVAEFEAELGSRGFRPLATFNPSASAVQSAFSRPPPRVFYGFFGATRNAEGAYTVPRQPKKWLRFSYAVYQRGSN